MANALSDECVSTKLGVTGNFVSSLYLLISCLYTKSNLKFYIEMLSHKAHKQPYVGGQKQVSTPPQCLSFLALLGG